MYSCVDPTGEKNIVLVVSPLVNLIKDQVSRLRWLKTVPGTSQGTDFDGS